MKRKKLSLAIYIFSSFYLILGFSFMYISDIAEAIESKSFIIKQGLPAQFRAARVEGAKYIWTFPAGNLEGSNVSYTFEEVGEQPVTLEVSKNGETNTITKTVRVYNAHKPTAVPKITVEGQSFGSGTIKWYRNQAIVFASDSTDAEGNKEGLKHFWIVNGDAYNDQEILNIFEDPGLYNIKLQVSKSGASNQRDEANVRLEVLNRNPIIQNFNVEADSELKNKKVTLSATAQDEDGEVTQYRFDVLERNVIRFSQLTKNPKAIFDLEQLPGKHHYNFRVIALDNNQGKTELIQEESIEIESTTENQAPEAEIIVAPGNQGNTKTSFLFSTNASDPDGDALKYEWEFPNGERKFTPAFSYQFPEAGVHTVHLTVDDGNETIETELKVTVTDENGGDGENQAPEIKIRGVIPSTGGDTNTVFSFYALATDANNDALTLSWDLGNGAKMFYPNIAYKFKNPGTYTVKVSASDGELESEDSITIEVVEEGKEIPQNDPKNNIEELLDEINQIPDQDLPDIQIIKPTTTETKYDPFSTGLQTLLSTQIKRLENELKGTTDPIRKAQIQDQIDTLREKTNQIAKSPFNLAQESYSRLVTGIKEQIAARKEALKNEKDPAKRKKLQEEIRELETKIKESKLLAGAQGLLENILRDSRESLIEKLKNEKDPEKRAQIKKEIAQIDQELEKLINNPFYGKTEQIKGKLINLKEKLETALEKETDPDKRAAIKRQIRILEQRINAIKINPEEITDENRFADLIGTTNTKFFFYGKAPKDFQKALFFEWKLGEDLKVPGQNIHIRYKRMGFYEIDLSITDGFQETKDTITIKIVPPIKDL